MSNFAENEFKNAKNDLKKSIENWQNVMRTCEESLQRSTRAKEMDYLIEKREEVAKMIIPWKAIFAVMEQLERLEEKIDKLEGGTSATPAIDMPIDLELVYSNTTDGLKSSQETDKVDPIVPTWWAGSPFDYKKFSKDLFK